MPNVGYLTSPYRASVLYTLSMMFRKGQGCDQNEGEAETG
jgi:hypothetical protein